MKLQQLFEGKLKDLIIRKQEDPNFQMPLGLEPKQNTNPNKVYRLKCSTKITGNYDSFYVETVTSSYGKATNNALFKIRKYYAQFPFTRNISFKLTKKDCEFVELTPEQAKNEKQLIQL